MPIQSTLTDWLKAIQMKPRHLFGISIFGAVTLLCPDSFATLIGINEFRDGHRSWIGLPTLGAAIFGVIQLIPEYRRKKLEREHRNAVISSLNTLSDEEWVMIAYCMEHSQQTIALHISDRVANALVARGLLMKFAGHAAANSWPFTIPKFLWEHLLSNRESFLGNAPLPAEEIKAGFVKLHSDIRKFDY
jgi:hypothetical protein